MSDTPQLPIHPVSRITIHNPVSCHYECIESVIHYLPQILGARYESEIHPQMASISLVLNIVPEPGFIKYITTYRDQMISRYGFADIIINLVQDVGYNRNPDITQIVLPLEPGDIRVFLTLPGCEFAKLEVFNWPNTYYILHNYRDDTLTPSNVFYLAPHCRSKLPNNYFIPDVLPGTAKSISYPDRPRQVPISEGAWILIQGRATRRVLSQIKILIKFAMRKPPVDGQPPVNLVILTKSNNFILQNPPPNIHIIINSDFWDFHQWVAKCNIIATLVNQQTHHTYYTRKLTSSISYGLAYQMRFLIDTALYNIYSDSLNSCFTYGNHNDFIKALKQASSSIPMKD